MPRELKPRVNALDILDPVAGEVVTILYRLPTTEERVGYACAMLEREGDEIVTRAFQTRLEFGSRLIIGVTAGSFSLDGQDVAEGPARADFGPLLAEAAPELVVALAYRVFEGARVLRSYDPAKEPKAANRPTAQAGTTGEVLEVVDGPLATGSGGA